MTELTDWRYPAARLLVFARTPVAGAVKTRLAAAIGAERAARLYRELVQGTLEMAVAARLAPVDLYVTPDTGHPGGLLGDRGLAEGVLDRDGEGVLVGHRLGARRGGLGRGPGAAGGEAGDEQRQGREGESGPSVHRVLEVR